MAADDRHPDKIDRLAGGDPTESGVPHGFPIVRYPPRAGELGHFQDDEAGLRLPKVLERLAIRTAEDRAPYPLGPPDVGLVCDLDGLPSQPSVAMARRSGSTLADLLTLADANPTDAAVQISWGSPASGAAYDFSAHSALETPDGTGRRPGAPTGVERARAT